jgi:hypothetical protein
MTKPKSQRIRVLDENIKKALKALASNEFPSLRSAASHFNIPRETLRRRFHGGQTYGEVHEPAQHFSTGEEKALTDLITRHSASGHPLTHGRVREMAEWIRNRRILGINEPAIQYIIHEPFGKEWVQRFLQRHPHPQSVMGQSIELARVKDSSPEVIENWFNVFRQAIYRNLP